MAQSFPPHRSQRSTPISSSLALSHLSTFLADAAKNPHLLPNATLQPNGPVAQGNADSNLTIQHLCRVEAGLRGEWLAPVLDLGEESDPFADTTAAGSGTHKKFDEDADMGTEGWQDLSEYQREQSIEYGEAEPREVVANGGTDAENTVPGQVKSSGKEGVDKAKDKEQRKKEKKEREKKEKREKAEKARLAASA